MTRTIRFTAKILRKQADLPRYVIVRPDLLEGLPDGVQGGRRQSFSAQVQLGDGPAFDRRIHPWGKGSDAFFFNLTQVQCRKAGLDTGDSCTVTIRPQGG